MCAEYLVVDGYDHKCDTHIKWPSWFNGCMPKVCGTPTWILINLNESQLWQILNHVCYISEKS